MRISGRTRVFAILGDPVGHSLSPAMQNAAFRALGLDAAYVALRCAADAVAGLMASLAAAGGGGNVTIPHKATAAHALTQPSPWVRAIDACNTFWGDEAGAEIHGDNTDIAGVLGALDALKVPAGPWLLAGTGGSARAVAAAARERGAALAVTSRDATGRRRSQPGQPRALGWRGRTRGVPGADQRDAARAAGQATPIRWHRRWHRERGAALDLVYRRGETEFVRRARARGLVAADGREVLVRQGAAAFMRWFPGATTAGGHHARRRECQPGLTFPGSHVRSSASCFPASASCAACPCRFANGTAWFVRSAARGGERCPRRGAPDVASRG